MPHKSRSAEVNFQRDLRSASGARIQRGIAIKLLRVVTLILLDIISLTLAWKFAVFFGTSLESSWTQKTSFILLIITIEVSVIAVQDLYNAGIHRRNYLGLLKAVSLSEVLLLLIAFLYEPDSYTLHTTFVLFWLSSAALICIFRNIFDVTTKFMRQKGAIRYPVFLIAETEHQEDYIKLI